MASHIPKFDNLESLSDIYNNYPNIFNIIVGYAILLPCVWFLKDYLPFQAPKQAFGISPKSSNISDQFQYSKDQSPGQTFKVKSLWVYPVKGCRGIEVESSKICNTGWGFPLLQMLHNHHSFLPCRSVSPSFESANHRYRTEILLC